MSRHTIFQILLVLWALAYAYSFAVFLITEPSGDGFVRGMNRVSAFLYWQAAAGLLGLGAWIAAKEIALSAAQRWLARLPALFAALLILGILALVLWATLTDPAGESAMPPQPVTQPVQR